ncbi:DNA ligase D [Bordetella genomosp. 8]|uniref:DNA ligase (ATP) n=1 Tax=Bordetella genomosp. 8 TaxID=1416806 RepID=A0A1W6YHW3_9BORD|nr:DNA ligase D [Bordetella genomosp. 8]ARP80650.1 DNA ligase D [Bordetella genomosp. 8]
MVDSLAKYRQKRNFDVTSEPAGGGKPNATARAFVIQKHWATRLHYDFRLELDGAMKSWAVPKGPSYDPSIKRMAVQVEDHPIAYNQFEGEIPKGQYGAGKVIIWDEGTWQPVGDPRKGYREGHLKFDLMGAKMQGRWALVRLHGKENERQPPWLLIKDRDEFARADAEFSVVDEMPDSVVPLRAQRKKALARAARPAANEAATDQATAKKTAAKKTTAKKAAAKQATTEKATARKATAKTATAKTAPRKRAAKTGAAADGADAATTDAAQHRLPGVARALPATLKPQLATLVDGVPPNPADWIYEVKFDGYRIVARLDEGGARLYTRNGHDWSAKMPHLVKALSALKVQDTWIDGEIVVLADHGAPSFQALQNAFDSDRTGDIVYYAFDLPFVAGRDLREEPVTVRRALLEQLLGGASDGPMRFSAAFDAPPGELVASACKMGLEGIIAKRRDSIYVSRRSDAWLKLKCAQRQEFIIVGYTDPAGSRKGLGALLVAVHDDKGELRYAGKVGTGFDTRGLQEMAKRLQAIEIPERPLPQQPELPRKAHWVKPELVAEVSFGEWTQSGHIRHSVFRGLRGDKPARAITREKPLAAQAVGKDAAADVGDGAPSRAGKAKAAKKAATKTAAKAPAGTQETVARPASLKGAPAGKGKLGRLSNPDRIIDPSTGLTKLDLARYYGLVAPLLLEHLKNRPVSLVRAPGGIQEPLFFQKHLEAAIPGVKPLPQRLDPGHPSLLEVPSDVAIVSAAQMNVVEFHTWNAVKTAIGKPDRMLFDLDPGEGVKWATLQQAAGLVRVLLRELGLDCWLKTSGGKGLHVVVPLRKQYGWDTVKDFSQAIVRHLASTLPQLFVAKSGPKNRVGKIFADYLRNGYGATTVAAWSARARPGLGISVPIAWDELPDIKGGAHWTISTAHTRLDAGNAPWDDYQPQAVSPAMKALDFDPKD